MTSIHNPQPWATLALPEQFEILGHSYGLNDPNEQRLLTTLDSPVYLSWNSVSVESSGPVGWTGTGCYHRLFLPFPEVPMDLQPFWMYR